MVVYLWDLNVDFINWSLAPETGDSACPTWDLLTRLIVNRTNYWSWILTKSYSVTSLQSAKPIEQRTTTTLTKSYVLLRPSHLLICSLPHTPYCIRCPWTRIIYPEGDLRHYGFLLKNGFRPTCGNLRARRPSQGLLVVHLPDVKAQRQKVIVSKWPHPLAPQESSHVVDTAGPALPRPCRVGHEAKIRKRNLSNAGREALSPFIFLENGTDTTLFLFPDFSAYMPSVVNQPLWSTILGLEKQIRPSPCPQGPCWLVEGYNEPT